jgi:carbonyl reductase 1
VYINQVVQIDVTDDASCQVAAALLKDKGVTLYALVNNAGMGYAQPGVGGTEAILNTNYYGPKRVTEVCVCACLCTNTKKFTLHNHR